MTQTVDTGKGIAEFPDDWTQSQIEAELRRKMLIPGGVKLPTFAQSFQQELEGAPFMTKLLAGPGAAMDIAASKLSSKAVDPDRLEAAKQVSQTLPGAIGGGVLQALATGPLYGAAGAAGPLGNILGSAAIGAGQGALFSPDSARGAGTGALFGAGAAAAGEGVGALINARNATIAARNASNAERFKVAQDAMDQNLKIPPSQTNRTASNLLLEGLSGKIQTGQHASVMNNPQVQKMAAQDLGIQGELTPSAVDDVITQAGKAYDAVRNAGPYTADDQLVRQMGAIGQQHQAETSLFKSTLNPDVTALSQEGVNLGGAEMSGPAIVEQIKRLRYLASENFKSNNPANATLARAQKQAANALEDQIARSLPEGSDVLQNFQNARTTIAKASAVKDAMEAGGGVNMSAQNLGKQMQNGEPLTGNLRTIAMAARNYPKAFQDPTKIGSVLPTSPLDMGMSMASLVGGLLSGGPVGGAAGALAWPTARMGARYLLLGPDNRWLATPNTISKLTPLSQVIPNPGFGIPLVTRKKAPSAKDEE